MEQLEVGLEVVVLEEKLKRRKEGNRVDIRLDKHTQNKLLSNKAYSGALFGFL